MTETHEVRMPNGMLITDVTQQRTSTSMASNARTLTLGAVWMAVPDYWTGGYLFKTLTRGTPGSGLYMWRYPELAACAFAIFENRVNHNWRN